MVITLVQLTVIHPDQSSHLFPLGVPTIYSLHSSQRVLVSTRVWYPPAPLPTALPGLKARVAPAPATHKVLHLLPSPPCPYLLPPSAPATGLLTPKTPRAFACAVPSARNAAPRSLQNSFPHQLQVFHYILYSSLFYFSLMCKIPGFFFIFVVHVLSTRL